MSSSSTSITKNTVVMESDEHNNNNNNIVEFDHDENDNHGNYDDDDDADNDSHDHIPMEEHHDLVIQQSMSIGTDDDDDDEHNHHDYYYSSDDGSRSYRTNHPNNNNNNNNGSFLYHSTKFWNTEQNLDHHPQQHLYNYLESTEGFLLNGNSSSRRNENHIILNHPRSGHKKNNKNSRNSSSSMSGWKCCVGTMLIFILLSIFAIVVPKKTRPTTNSSSSSSDAASSSSSFSNNNNNTIFTLPSIHKFKGAPQYSCPNVNNNNNNNVNTNTMEDEAFNNRFGNRIDVNLIQQDIPEFVNTFRDRDIRQYMNIGWNYSNSSPINVTYNTWKEQMTHWRTTKYIPSLKKTGANIFEVNCGLGLNLFMTYEIIHQSQPKDDIRDVHLYGSTTTTPTRHFSHYYNDDSIRTAMTANVVLDTILQKEANFVGGGKRGMICPTTTTTTTTTTAAAAPAPPVITMTKAIIIYRSICHSYPTIRLIWYIQVTSHRCGKFGIPIRIE